MHSRPGPLGKSSFGKTNRQSNTSACMLAQRTYCKLQRVLFMAASSASLTMAQSRCIVVAIAALSAALGHDVGLAQSVEARAVDARAVDARQVEARQDRASGTSTVPQLVDGWRRTAFGWEQLSLDPTHPVACSTPSQHIALAQVWPAAWAACIVLLVFGLAAAGTKRE